MIMRGYSHGPDGHRIPANDGVRRRGLRRIDRYCRDKGILWFASCWDEKSVDFIDQFEPPLLPGGLGLGDRPRAAARMRATGRPIIMSTGMSTLSEIHVAVEVLGPGRPAHRPRHPAIPARRTS